MRRRLPIEVAGPVRFVCCISEGLTPTRTGAIAEMPEGPSLADRPISGSSFLEKAVKVRLWSTGVKRSVVVRSQG